MPKRKQIDVTKESPTGRNEQFVDTSSGLTMTRAQFVRRIEQGLCPGFHVRDINGIKTPVSNPDEKKGNNLG